MYFAKPSTSPLLSCGGPIIAPDRLACRLISNVFSDGRTEGCARREQEPNAHHSRIAIAPTLPHFAYDPHPDPICGKTLRPGPSHRGVGAPSRRPEEALSVLARVALHRGTGPEGICVRSARPAPRRSTSAPPNRTPTPSSSHAPAVLCDEHRGLPWDMST